MDLYYFISKRINRGKKGSFSATVSSIAVISISVGLLVMIISFSILEGFRSRIQNKIFSFGSHLQVTKYEMARSYAEAPLTLGSDLYQHPERIPEIEHIQAVSHNLGLLRKRDNDEFTGAILKGVGLDYDTSRFVDNLTEGTFIDLKDSAAGTKWSNQIMVSRRIADKLQISVGDKVYMFFMKKDVLTRPLVVKGIYETGLEEFDELIIIGDIRLNQSLNEWGDSLVGGYEIFVKDFSRLDQAYDKVFEEMDPEMQIEVIRDKYIQIFDWLTLLDRNVVIFLFLILFVACFNMVSTLFIMIMERINMIGLLKALGATNKQIQTIFFYNGIGIIVKGLLIGNLIGLGFCFIQYYAQLIPLDPENYYMNTVPIEWNWMVIAGLNLLTFILVGLVLIIPIMVISNIKPIKAIKFD